MSDQSDPASGTGPQGLPRERQLFNSVRDVVGDRLSASSLMRSIERSGLAHDDPRLKETMGSLRELQHQRVDEDLDFDAFTRIIGPNVLVVEQVLQGSLVIPDFIQFRHELGRIFEKVKSEDGGSVADYIPQLSRVNPDQLGLSVVTIDGQQCDFGESQVDFCIQSTCKPILYCMALEEHGAEYVHHHVGCEPSGVSFNELALNRNGRPHNPMINAGAIMSGALIKSQLSIADRFDHVMGTWRSLAGGQKPGFSNGTYLSERQTADRNFALGYFMREKGAFPEGTDLVEALEFYFQCCSIEMTTHSMSMVAATLANGGVCPTTGERILHPATVRKCLSMMDSCGMYDFSGEWAFSIGLPAKSGVSGAIMVVIPNVLGLCVWSPPLDAQGNSVRGIEVCRELVKTYNFHNYDSLAAGHGKIDPRLEIGQVKQDEVGDVCWAASEGDLGGLRRMAARGVDLSMADYDGRTALHLAACGGHLNVIQFLATHGLPLAPLDRWNNTPLDDARREGHGEVERFLEECLEP